MTRYLKVLGSYPRCDHELTSPSARAVSDFADAMPDPNPTESAEPSAPAVHTKPPTGWRLASREHKANDTLIQVGDHVIGGDTATLQVGKKDVGLADITQAGRYALKLHFDDGHDSGLYSWDYLDWLIREREANWTDYLKRLDEAGASREPLGIEIRQL